MKFCKFSLFLITQILYLVFFSYYIKTFFDNFITINFIASINPNISFICSYYLYNISYNL